MRVRSPAFLAALFARALVAGPSLVCEQPQHDFGPQVNTQAVCHAFLLSNRGDQPVAISQVISGCDCIRAAPNPGRIAPGETFALDVRFDLKGRTGPQNKPVFVIWNGAPNTSTLCLTMAGNAMAPVAVAPPSVAFGDVGPTGAAERTVRVYTPVVSQAFRVTGVSCSDPRFRAQILDTGSNRLHTVTVTAPEPRQPAAVSARLTIATDHPCCPSLDVPLSMRVLAKP